jgi:drug/metabolite transporter (DMT)-like permease
VRTLPNALKLLALGALVGPVLGVSASLLAVQHAEIGVASTLMALPPVFLLPIGYFAFNERFSWQTIAGTFVAMIGVALLFLA